MKNKIIVFQICFMLLFTAQISSGQSLLLTTNYNNNFTPLVCTSSPDDWAKCQCNNDTWPTNTNAPFEWKRVGEDQKIFGLSGTVMYQVHAGSDFPLSHVFGFDSHKPNKILFSDWESYIVVDPDYANLLGKGNNPKDAFGNWFNNEYSTAIYKTSSYIKTLNVITKRYQSLEFGVMGLEIDSAFIPNEYASMEKDRTVVFGDLIADCGHDEDGFHTEIHPPLMIVNARPFAFNPLNSQQKLPDNLRQTTFASIISCPYKITQYFNNSGSTFLNEAEAQIGYAYLAALGALPFTFGQVATWQFAMDADLADKPFKGVQDMSFDIYPQRLRDSASEQLWAQYHFTVRNGVTVKVLKGDDHYTINVKLDETLYHSANNLLIKHTRNLNRNDFILMGYGDVYDKVYAGVALSPLSGFIPPGLDKDLSQGINTTIYEVPKPHSNFDLGIFPSSIQPGIYADISDEQPYPIYGWMTVGWLGKVEIIPCALNPSPLTSNVNEVHFFPNNLDKSQLITVTNPTDKPVQLGKLSLEGTNPDRFALQHHPITRVLGGGSQPPEDCSNTILQPHASCSFRVKLLPGANGNLLNAVIVVPGGGPCPLKIQIRQLNGVN